MLDKNTFLQRKLLLHTARVTCPAKIKILQNIMIIAIQIRKF